MPGVPTPEGLASRFVFQIESCRVYQYSQKNRIALNIMEDLKIFLCSLEKMYQDRYVSFLELEEIKKRMPESLAVSRTGVKLKKFGTKEERKAIKKINFYLRKRKKLNQKFVQQKQKEKFEVEGNLLDPQQIEAVVACEDAELILASAGSGKSASLLAKVNYIVRDLGVPADEVLVIAFTRKVVKELQERMKGSGVEICTFHSFGNKIIQNLNVDLKLVPDDFLEKTSAKILQSLNKKGEISAEFLKEFGDMDGLLKMIISTLQLQKNEQISFKEFKSRIIKMKDKKELEKALKFYGLYVKVAKIYSKILRDNRLYDFSDMLSWATRIVERMPRGTLEYRYILVDEVQDLSLSKSLLLQAILKNCKGVKLFAVGDDWQSIYRFAGSNLGVLKNFEKTFGLYTYRGVIRRTYRFGQPTAWVSEYFIRKNPHQSKKKVQTFKKGKTPIVVRLVEKNKKIPTDYAAVDAELQKMFLEMGDEIFEKRVQVVSRYNKDLYRLVDARTGEFKNAKIVETREDGVVLDWQIEKAGRPMTVAFCSMHKSKGITRDIVFVINMNEGKKGMPSTRADDPILATMLARVDKYPLAEERRLFYVAMTRATEKTIMVSEKGKISRFVREIAGNLGGEVAEMVLD